MGVFTGTPKLADLTEAQWQERLCSFEHWQSCIAGYGEQLDDKGFRLLFKEQASGARIAFWRSDKSGFACNGGDSTLMGTCYAGMVQTVKGPLIGCTRQALHATMRPPRWNGSRLWLVSLRGEVAGDPEKWASLERVIIGEVRE